MTNNIKTNDVSIVIPLATYRKLFAYVLGIDQEISGIGSITREGNIITVNDIFLLDQVVSSAHTTLDKNALAKFLDEKGAAGEDLSQYKLWWHSHNTMDTFWSQTDSDTCDDFDTEQEQNNWTLSIVANHQKSLKIRLDIFQPFRTVLDDLPYEIKYLDTEPTKAIAAEIAKKVTKPAPLYAGYNGYNNFTDDWSGKKWEWVDGEWKKVSKRERKANRKARLAMARKNMANGNYDHDNYGNLIPVNEEEAKKASKKQLEMKKTPWLYDKRYYE